MKKILIITTISGFLSQFEMNDVDILQKAGCEIHYASNFQNPVYETNTEKLKRRGIRIHPITIEKSPRHIIHNLRALCSLCGIIRREGIQVIHCHNPMGGVLGRLAAALCPRQRVKIIYTAHGFHFYKGAPLINWLCFYPVERILARITDCLITINHEDYKRALRFKLRQGGKTVLIPGVGVRMEKFRPENADTVRGGKRWEMRRQLGISDDSFFILSVGELNKNKNHEIILKAMVELGGEDIYYGICGKGKRDSFLKELAAKLGVERQLKLFGFRNDIPDMLLCADCFAFPSKREGLGIAAIEAMAAGLPLITSNCRGTREYMTDGVNGYICKENTAQAYAGAIRRLLKDSRQRKRMGEQSMKRAADFDLSETDKIMRKTYGDLIYEKKRT